MCVVSMIGDHYNDRLSRHYPQFYPSAPSSDRTTLQEFDALKAEVEQMKELLKKAKAYDERNGEPECEVDEKMAALRSVARLVGIDLDDVIKPKGA